MPPEDHRLMTEPDEYELYDDANQDLPPEKPLVVNSDNATRVLKLLVKRIEAIKAEVGRCMVGADGNTEAALFALLSRGHCLIEGVPGLGKTLFVRALSRVLSLHFARIQFTPDLMPPDITGTIILQEESSGHREFQFVRGPIFTHILLADEINRTPPKTQAALLEAMQERQVTVSGHTYELEEPFLVLATQNPIEQEGTYPLPEAQLDRFLFQLQVEYPSLEEEKQIVAQHSFTPLESLKPQVSRAEVIAFREAVAMIPAATNVIDYAARLVRATRPDRPGSLESVSRWIRWGASPRASLNLILAGKARAACQGRFNVSVEDCIAVAPMVLRHRIIRSFHADADGMSADDIIQQLIQDVPRSSP
jgi:MoxR-like ATPase